MPLRSEALGFCSLDELSFHDVPAFAVTEVAETNQGLIGFIHDSQYLIRPDAAHRA